MDNESISKATGLSIEEIRKLRPDGKNFNLSSPLALIFLSLLTVVKQSISL